MPGGQQSLRPLPLPLSQPGQAPRPAGAPPRPGGGAPPAVAPGVGLPAHLPAHHHHHPPHMPPPPPQPEFDVSAFLSSAD